MIAVDTNVLIRLLVGDDADQALRAQKLIELASESGERCYVGDPVLCELEWVLESVYGASRKDVFAAVTHVLRNEVFTLEDPKTVAKALDAFAKGKGNFSDYLLGARAKARGAETTYTFDRSLRNSATFTLL